MPAEEEVFKPHARVPFFGLRFTQEDTIRMRWLLDELLQQTRARCALLLTRDGDPVVRYGDLGEYDLRELGAAVAKSCAAEEKLARVLGEESLGVAFPQRGGDNIHIVRVGDRAIIAVLFGEPTLRGGVQVYAHEAANDLNTLLEQIAARS